MAHAGVIKVLEEAGIEPQRFKVEWIAGSEGGKFADTVKKMVSELEKLGPVSKEAAPDE